jgi:hypothetical protein
MELLKIKKHNMINFITKKKAKQKNKLYFTKSYYKGYCRIITEQNCYRIKNNVI